MHKYFFARFFLLFRTIRRFVWGREKNVCIKYHFNTRLRKGTCTPIGGPIVFVLAFFHILHSAFFTQWIHLIIYFFNLWPLYIALMNSERGEQYAIALKRYLLKNCFINIIGVMNAICTWTLPIKHHIINIIYRLSQAHHVTIACPRINKNHLFIAVVFVDQPLIEISLPWLLISFFC